MKNKQPAILPILLRSIVKSFYRQNAGALVFIFILFFGAIGEVGGDLENTGPILQLEYEYALIHGMLASPVLFSLVCLAWLIYAQKNAEFVLGLLQRPDYSFLHILNTLERRRLFNYLLVVQVLLFLPVILYMPFVIGVAIYKGWWGSGLLVAGYVLFLCLGNSVRYYYQVRQPGRPPLIRLPRPKKNPAAGKRVTPYWSFFTGYILSDQKLIFAGTKLFSCGVLFASLKAVTAADYDIRMPLLLFGIGLFGHGILIYKFRDLEEKALLFYRGLPVMLPGRFLQYALLYLILFIPEAFVLFKSAPHPLRYADALKMAGCGYGILLLLNSILFTVPVTMKVYLKILLCLFIGFYFFVLAGWLSVFIFLTLVSSGTIFSRQYYRYEAENTLGIE